MITAGSRTRRILADETSHTTAGFYKRARAWFVKRGVTVERVLNDNGGCYRSSQWCEAMRTTNTHHKRTRPYRPQTNGKVEHFHRTFNRCRILHSAFHTFRLANS
ncbi:MAG: DDE-type integrase/transposase/recombinase [Acidimicrobiaceae bacterium]|nr:DDE-type integrase/transposase/recombinase [Acidimicrobiaceae bacterium]MDE0268482.1 DDE-type integrase/transposase/recombinase [Acidimicrobiaceae bacterium]